MALVSAPVQAGLFVTADVYSTPGLDGYTTYDLSLSTSEGAFLSFVFDPAVGSGISGPLYQSPGFMGTASAVLDGGLDAGNRADSRFLLSPSAKTLNFNNSESDSHLATVFGTFAPDLDYSITTTPFARLVTNTPDLVHVLGSVGISPSRGADAHLFDVDFRLSDLAEWSSPMPADVPEAKAIAKAEAWQAELRAVRERMEAEEAERASATVFPDVITTYPPVHPGETSDLISSDPPSGDQLVEDWPMGIEVATPILTIDVPGTTGWIDVSTTRDPASRLFTDLERGNRTLAAMAEQLRIVSNQILSMTTPTFQTGFLNPTFQTTFLRSTANDGGDALGAWSTLSAYAFAYDAQATPEPGACALVMVAITAAAGVTRRG